MARPGTTSDLTGFLDVDIGRALEAGLRLRPLEGTARDTLRWARERDGVPAKEIGVAMAPAGLDPGREAELLSGVGGA